MIEVYDGLNAAKASLREWHFRIAKVQRRIDCEGIARIESNTFFVSEILFRTPSAATIKLTRSPCDMIELLNHNHKLC